MTEKGLLDKMRLSNRDKFKIAGFTAAMMTILIGVLYTDNLRLKDELNELKGSLDGLKSEMREQVTQNSKMEKEISIREVETKGYLKWIVGGVVIVIVLAGFGYIGGIDPGSVGSALNDLGNQSTNAFKYVLSNNSENFKTVVDTQVQCSERMEGKLETIKELLVRYNENVNRSIAQSANPKGVTEFFQTGEDVSTIR